MSDPTLYLYTSLTAGSSHIVTATARLETILKANKLPFRAIDVATDEVARKLWGRRSKGKKLPGLVKFGTVVGVRIPPPSQRRVARWLLLATEAQIYTGDYQLTSSNNRTWSKLKNGMSMVS